MHWRTCLVTLGVCAVYGSLLASCLPHDFYHDFREDVPGSGGNGGTNSAGNGAGGAKNGDCKEQETCALPGEGLKGPYLVWWGPAGTRPKAPDRAQAKEFNLGRGDLDAPVQCEPCQCGKLQHTCGLPTGITAFDQPQCPAGQQGQPFDPASSWDGKCDDHSPIPAPNAVHSLSVAALALTESCAPVQATPKPVQAHWKLDVAAFANSLDPCGHSNGTLCLPNLHEPGDPPEGFHLCMMNSQGDVACHDDRYTEKHVFYEDDVEDQRTCTACTCTPPASKGLCTSVISVFEDVACGGSAVVPGIQISSEVPTCVDINPPGQALGSKKATDPQYTPALGEPTCQPGGGEIQGEIKMPMPTTFCCIPLGPPLPPPPPLPPGTPSDHPYNPGP